MYYSRIVNVVVSESEKQLLENENIRDFVAVNLVTKNGINMYYDQNDIMVFHSEVL